MSKVQRLQISLLSLRLGVFLVMLVWTVDKFLSPGHVGAVFEKFYFIKGLESAAIYGIGAVEMVIIAGFVLGIAKRFTYGTVLVLHGISTLSSFPMYLNPAKGMLFFAAWPMLAACIALYLLRDEDQLWTVGRASASKAVAD